jgi:hypothetical protein
MPAAVAETTKASRVDMERRAIALDWPCWWSIVILEIVSISLRIEGFPEETAHLFHRPMRITT